VIPIIPNPEARTSERARDGCRRYRSSVSILVSVMLLAVASVPAIASPTPVSGQAALLLRVVRTGPTEASLLGVALTPSDVVELLVNGSVIASRAPEANLDYWFLHVGVTDTSIVETRIGLATSPAVLVPAYVAQPAGPLGFISAQGSRLVRNGQPIQLFGATEQTAFIYALSASGLWNGPPDLTAWGRNQLFPSGPDAKIPGVIDADSFWREYFRYFLHYNSVAGSPTNPKANVLRIWIADDSWVSEGTYLAWKANATVFWNVFDRMVYWANRSGFFLVPVLGHFDGAPDNRFFVTTTLQYAHQLEVVRAMMDRYDSEPRIAMWDLWNEPDVNNDVYWATVGGIVGFRAWASQYIADVKPHSPHHLITIGTAGESSFPGVPGLGWRYHFFFNDMPGLEVSQHHTSGTAEDAALIDWETAWHEALGIPHFEGNYMYSLQPGPNPVGYGYWPWFTEQSRARGWPAVTTTVLFDDGKGPYADYPYTGPLPSYPASAPPPNGQPRPSFVFSPSAPRVASAVQFDASASTDDQGIVQYRWDFGDGQAGTGAVVDHVYAVAGTYNVRLTAWDADGSGDSSTVGVPVEGQGGASPNGPLAALPSGFLWMVVAGLICALIATAAGLSRGLRRRRGVARTVSTVKPRMVKSEPTRPALEEQPSEAPDESVTGEQADQEIDELFRDLDEMEASTARASEGIEAEDSPVATRPKKR